MTVAVLYPSFPAFHAAARRFALALAMSAITHMFLIQSLIYDVPQRAAQSMGAATISVRLEPPAGPVVPVPEPPPVAPQDRPRVGAADGSRNIAPPGAGARLKQDTVATLALPQAPDPTYYSARDLDDYPRPAAPLDLDRFSRGVTGGLAGRFRLALLIDEDGVVKEITVIEAEPPGRLQEDLRAALAATLFLPGRKDGRAVRSRVLLSVNFGSEKREP
jgi:protein TonB